MNSLSFPSTVEIQSSAPAGSPCFAHAVAEISRLLKKSGMEVVVAPATQCGNLHILRMGWSGSRVPERFPSELFPDAYSIFVSSKGAAIVSTTAKGVLNGVYDLAERLGFVFLLPGEAGEWVPDVLRPLPHGRTVSNPRFRHRGIQYGGLTHDYEVAEWLAFYAKLRLNAVCLHGPELQDNALALRLGLRIETGGHGYRELLPRKLFDRQPELFRMIQPEDFGGKRVSDFNSCTANPEARKIMRDNYRREALEANKEGFYSLHRWPDDLPGGGWCLCPHCRGLAPSDQAMLAMRNLGEAVREEKLPMRVAMVAYHDTMMPAWDVAPSRETFLLYAARERCYGHRLDDPNCARNAFYMRALVEWMNKFRGIDDAHTCEYYSDQILYRGLHPYTPDVIAGDTDAYVRCGIEAHMVLHIGGAAVSPDWNMLFFARNVWESGLTSKGFNASVQRSFGDGDGVIGWSRYLDARAQIFTDALRMCDHEVDSYLDYRFLPGTAKPFGKQMAGVYRKCSEALAAVAGRLEKSASPGAPVRMKQLIAAEVARARFEAAELAVMSHQQESVNHAIAYLLNRQPAELESAIASGENAVRAFRPALTLAKSAGIPEKCWYPNNINRMLTKETKEKMKVWKKGLKAAV